MPKTPLSMKLRLLKKSPRKKLTLLFMESLNLPLQTRPTKKVLTSCSTSFLRTVDFRRRARTSQLFGEWSLMQYLVHEQVRKWRQDQQHWFPRVRRCLASPTLLFATCWSNSLGLERQPPMNGSIKSLLLHQRWSKRIPQEVQEVSHTEVGRSETCLPGWPVGTERCPIPTLVSSCLQNWLLRPI